MLEFLHMKQCSDWTVQKSKNLLKKVKFCELKRCVCVCLNALYCFSKSRKDEMEQKCEKLNPFLNWKKPGKLLVLKNSRAKHSGTCSARYPAANAPSSTCPHLAFARARDCLSMIEK